MANIGPRTKTQNLFLIHAEPIHAQSFETLRARGYEVALLTQRVEDPEQTLRTAAPSALHLTLPEACAGVIPRGFRDLHAATAEDLRALAPATARSLQCLDFSNIPAASMIDVQRRYVKLVGLWRSLLDSLAPSAVVFNCDVSFRGFDLVLYELCQKSRIPTVIFNHTLIEDRQIVLSEIDAVPGPSKEELDAYPAQNPNPSPVSSPASEAMNKSYNDATKIRAKLTTRAILRGLIGRQQLARTKPTTYFVSDPRPRHLKLRAYTALGKIAARRCLKLYDSIARPPQRDEKFVYFPLQIQPEESTAVLGDVFTDLWHTLATLSEGLPPGWKIYVKEHPNQFNRAHRFSKGRSTRFYEELSEIRQAQLVPLETSGNHLIGQCQAVCTTAGSTGFEAVKAGKPALVFGHPWYARAPGVFRVESSEDCRLLLGKISNGEVRVSVDFVKRYERLMLERYTLPLLPSRAFFPFLDRMTWTIEDQGRRYADAISAQLDSGTDALALDDGESGNARRMLTKDAAQ